jgi:hypothetical protein
MRNFVNAQIFSFHHPDFSGGLSHEALAAELTNHFIDGVVLTPGMVATSPELQRAGFHYAT